MSATLIVPLTDHQAACWRAAQPITLNPAMQSGELRDEPPRFGGVCGRPLTQGGTDAFCTEPSGHEGACVWAGVNL